MRIEVIRKRLAEIHLDHYWKDHISRWDHESEVKRLNETIQDLQIKLGKEDEKKQK